MAGTWDDVEFTAGEKAKLAWIVARMAKRGIAGDNVHIGDLKRRADRIEKTARKRMEQAEKNGRKSK
ncbi:DUF6257 family protein [Streptomyces sp. WAC06614]|uniref:DUF6257 family protein n=1 Tax=Streptomyces sp. WAC06614 TaxID=2487416 RepID=UPI000F77F6AC|nr:DUF6257 family protein [Streptomyces sp. WAC06614]RSS79494.1 hypothetical protein EF918_17180 [Streptomyces sp. WAC06614]